MLHAQKYRYLKSQGYKASGPRLELQREVCSCDTNYKEGARYYRFDLDLEEREILDIYGNTIRRHKFDYQW